MKEIVYIIPALIALFWVIRIFIEKNASATQLYVGAGMLMSAVSLFYQQDTVSLVFPFLYMAVRRRTSDSGTGRFDWFVFLPSILFLPFNRTLAFEIFLSVQIVAISVWCYVKLHKYNTIQEEYYAEDDSSSESLGEILTYTIATALIISVLMLIPEGELPRLIQIALVAFICVLQFMIGVRNCQIGDVRSGESAPVTTALEDFSSQNADAGGELPSQNSTAVLVGSTQLQRVIDEKLYLDPLLSLTSLAETLNTNRTYLSNSIHSCYNQNFSEFINSLRIRYAVTLMEETGSNARIKEIAQQAGYNNLQSFYRHFTEIMDMTPKAWLSKQ